MSDTPSRSHVASRVRRRFAFVLVGSALSVLSASSDAGAGGNCGPEPKAPVCHGHATCTADAGWTFDPLPAGTSCTQRNGQSGVCSPNGFCGPPPRTGTVRPAYYVLAVLYSPPGNKSKVTYADGSSAGTTTSTSNMFGAGITAGVTGNVIATASYQVSQQSSDSFQVKKTTSDVIDLTSVTDPLRHGEDRFYLWMNPLLSVTQAGNGPVLISVQTVNGQPMDIVDVTADELTGVVALPAQKQQKLSGLTKADFSQIVALDPPAVSGGMDPSRYAFVQTLQLEGPDQAGGDLPGHEVDVSDDTFGTKANSTTTTYKVSIGVSAGFCFLAASEKAEAIDTLTWANTSSAGTTYGSNQTAKVDLSTTTVGFYDNIDVYEDLVYHTFAFVSQTQGRGFAGTPPSMTGTVMSPSGQPVPDQIVTVTLANGRTQRVFTNARGTYRVFGAPAGATTLAIGGVVSRATVTPGRPVVQHMRLNVEPQPRPRPTFRR